MYVCVEREDVMPTEFKALYGTKVLFAVSVFLLHLQAFVGYLTNGGEVGDRFRSHILYLPIEAFAIQVDIFFVMSGSSLFCLFSFSLHSLSILSSFSFHSLFIFSFLSPHRLPSRSRHGARPHTIERTRFHPNGTDTSGEAVGGGVDSAGAECGDD